MNRKKVLGRDVRQEDVRVKSVLERRLRERKNRSIRKKKHDVERGTEGRRMGRRNKVVKEQTEFREKYADVTGLSEGKG